MGNTVSNYVNSFKNSQYYYTNYGPDSRLFQNGYNISTMLYNTGYVAPQYQYSYNPSRMNFPFQNDYNFGVFPNSFGYMNPQYQYGYNQGVLPFNTNLSSGGIDLTPTGFDAATFTTAPNNISTVDNTYVHSPDQVADSTPLEINISEKDLRKYKKELINDAAQAEMDAQGSLGTSMLFTVPFAAPAVIKAAKNLNNGASNIFHQLDNNGTAKYKDLWKSHPYQMEEAQKEFGKLSNNFLKEYKKLKKEGVDTQELVKDYKNLTKKMIEALNENDIKKVAKATEDLRTANGIKYKNVAEEINKHNNKNGTNIDPKKYNKSELVEDKNKNKNVKPVKGAGFKKYLGGPLALGISALATIAMGFSDYGNIKEAYAIDKENKENNKETNYGRQQFKQTLIKMGTLGVSSLLGQAAVETLNTKLHGAKIDLISKKTKKYAKKIAVKTAKKVGGKFLTKIVTKLATKGACKALGAALGTLIPIPGVGTAIGLLIGTAAEWAISKYVLPKFYDDGVQAAEHAKIDNMTEEQALVNICNKLANDVPLLDSEEKLYKKNKMICDNYVIQIKAEAQAAQDNAQANPNDAASVDRTA